MMVYKELNAIFERFNNMFEEYLGDKLDIEDIVFTLQRKNKVVGYLVHNSFENTEGVFKHEISLNPEYFTVKPKIEILRVFCQELLKLYRIYYGDPETLKMDYYDADWGAYMLTVGLMPSHNGKPDGKDTGKKMSSYVLPDGPFLQLCNELAEEGLLIDWFDKIPAKYEIENLMLDLYELNDVMVLEDIHHLLIEVPILKRKKVDVMSFIQCLDRNENSKKIEINEVKAEKSLIIKPHRDDNFTDNDLEVSPLITDSLVEVVTPATTDSNLDWVGKDLEDVMYDRTDIPVKKSEKNSLSHIDFSQTTPFTTPIKLTNKDQIADLLGIEKPKPPSVRRSNFKYTCGCGDEVTAPKENMRFTCNSCQMGFRCETETYESNVASSA